MELRGTVGDENYHPVYSSAKNDMICYSSMLTPAESSQFNHFHTILTIPNFVKIHHSVMQLASNMEKSSAYYLEVHRGLGVRGKGISKVSGSSIADRVIENMKSGRNKDAQAFVSAMAHSSSKEGSWAHMWHETTNFVKSSSGRDVAQSCGFHRVTVEGTKFGLRVNGVEHTRAHASCVLLLAAHLVSSSDDVIMVLANKQQIPLNNFARPITQTGVSAIANNAVVSGSAPYSSAGLNGLNEVVGVGDTGLDELMCFFTEGDGTIVTRSTIEDPITNSSRRKVVQYIAFQDGGDYEEGHGTHVSGSVAGQDIDESDSQSVYNGLGYAAKIAFFDLTPGEDSYIFPPSDMYNDFYGVTATSGAHISTNSWGSSTGYYESMALQTDEYLYDNPEFLVLFAAGNDGSNGYSSVGSPAVCKNMVTVGATETGHNLTATPLSNPSVMAFFSSVGPTYDGRIKPDVCAPGYYIFSAMSSNNSETGTAETCEVTNFAGTSMATPVTASNSAMIRQYFANESFWQAECSKYTTPASSCSAFSPSGVLVKAVLITSGEPMYAYLTRGRATVIPDTILGVPPDYFQGYGRVMLSNVLPLAGTTHPAFQLFVQDLLEIKQNTVLKYSVTVTNRSLPLAFTVSWYDPPNSFWSGKAVLNDIDVIVTSPSGVISYGNNIKGDELNNNERVVVASPELGQYSVQVMGKLFAAGVCSSGSGYCQKVAVVAVSSGQIKYVSTSNINSNSYVNNEARENCDAAKGNIVYVGMPSYGISYWGSSSLTIDSTSTDFKTTVSPATVSAGYENEWAPTATTVCLADGEYTLSMKYEGEVSGGSIDACGVYVGAFQTQQSFTIQGDSCVCNNGYTTLELTAYSLETWFDYYYYEITYIGTESLPQNVWRGSLPASNLGYQKLCLPPGTYEVSLNNTDGAPYPIAGISLSISTCGVYLNETGTTAVCEIVNSSPSSNDDDDGWTLGNGMNNAAITLTVVLVVSFSVGIGAAVYFVFFASKETAMSAALLKV